MPNKLGEYIIPAYTWNDEQTALDKGYTELIRCRDCRHYGDDAYCDAICRIGMTEDDYCSRAERKEECSQ